MSSVSGIRAALQRLEGLTDSQETEVSPAMQLSRRGLDLIHSNLQGQLLEEMRTRVDVRLDGLAVHGHEIRIDTLSQFLHSMQETLSSVAQALVGKATARAAIPGPLRDSTALRLSAVYPGSFGATLRGPWVAYQESLFEDLSDDTETILDMAATRLLNILEIAGRNQVEEEPIVETVLPLGSRSFKHLRDLSTVMADEQVSAEIVWKPAATSARWIFVSHSAARRLDDVLGRNKVSEHSDVIEGRLGTVSDIRNRIEIELPSGEIRSARVVEELVPELGRYYSRRVRATFEVTTVRSQVTGREKNAYVLTDLELASP